MKNQRSFFFLHDVLITAEVDPLIRDILFIQLEYVWVTHKRKKMVSQEGFFFAKQVMS